MKKFIVIQMQINADTYVDGVLQTNMSNTVRQVDAESEAEAIGKFVLGTKDIEAKQKLNIECYELSKLKSVN